MQQGDEQKKTINQTISIIKKVFEKYKDDNLDIKEKYEFLKKIEKKRRFY